ncbi:hypothetical protein C7401_10328 [Paraburkholderia unamae]|uniref:hypothetical protein n=1 Tax=Paraburkholderia unamae TaxID=219649 RepID=UPI000DC54463|nr:hypothetical protein [Paraburkholderia unamae]RAR65722.1 hypothetical protein C7401_10328 [Paraburkholderia unamae]
MFTSAHRQNNTASADAFTGWRFYQELHIPEDGGKGGTARFRLRDGTMRFIKGCTGSPARVLFAERLLARFGQAQTPESRVILRDSDEFREIGEILAYHFDRQLKRNPNDAATLTVRRNSYVNADYLIVMQAAQGASMSELTDKREPPDKIEFLRECLTNDDFLRLMGKILAVDTLLGNADRFETVNGGNAFISRSATGQIAISAIDNDTVLPSLETNQAYKPRTYLAPANVTARREWALDIIQNDFAPTPGLKKDEYDLMSSPKRVMGTKFSFAANLKNAIGKHATREIAQGLDAFADWGNIDKRVQEGVAMCVDSMLKSRYGFEELKMEFRERLAQFGGVDNAIRNGLFDLDALRIRSKYMVARNSGATHEAAMNIVQDFAEIRGVQPKQFVGDVEARALKFGSVGAAALKFAGKLANPAQYEQKHGEIARLRNLDARDSAAIRNEVLAAFRLMQVTSPADVTKLSDHEFKLAVIALTRLAQSGLENRVLKLKTFIREINAKPGSAVAAQLCRAVCQNASEAVTIARRYRAVCNKVNPGQYTFLPTLETSIANVEGLISQVEAIERRPPVVG